MNIVDEIRVNEENKETEVDRAVKETKALVDSIKNGQIYKDYQECKARIDDDLREKVDAFRKNSFEIQINQNYGSYNAYEQLIKLTDENEQILSDPDVKNFLDAELKLSKLLSKIYNCIYEAIDFDISFLE